MTTSSPLRTLASRAAALLLTCGLCSPAVSAMEAPTAVAAHPPVPDTIQQRAMACTSCHGVHGEGSRDSEGTPRLAGKPAGYLLEQLRYFQKGQRKHAAMEYVVRQLDLAYLRELAEYFARQEVPYRRQPVPAVSAQILQRGQQLVEHGDAGIGVPACTSCHGNRLTGVQPMMPGLMGLSYDYITTELTSWRTNTRAAKEPYCMGIVANRMREADVTAVAAWLASREPPADMYPIPASAPSDPLPGWCVMGESGVDP